MTPSTRMAEQKREADGEKLAVLRKGRANLAIIWAAAHAQRSLKINIDKRNPKGYIWKYD